MIVYVESNFILELSLDQDEAAVPGEILGLAEARTIERVIPSFALSEPFSATERKGNIRNSLQQPLFQHVRDLRRSKRHQAIADRLNEATIDFLAVTDSEMAALEATLGRMLQAATIAPMTRAIYAEALTYKARFGISTQDAIIFASVIDDLRQRERSEEKCFVSRNSKDFGDSGIDAELKAFGCRYISRFTDALAFARSRLLP